MFFRYCSNKCFQYYSFNTIIDIVWYIFSTKIFQNNLSLLMFLFNIYNSIKICDFCLKFWLKFFSRYFQIYSYNYISDFLITFNVTSNDRIAQDSRWIFVKILHRKSYILNLKSYLDLKWILAKILPCIISIFSFNL